MTLFMYNFVTLFLTVLVLLLVVVGLLTPHDIGEDSNEAVGILIGYFVATVIFAVFALNCLWNFYTELRDSAYKRVA